MKNDPALLFSLRFFRNCETSSFSLRKSCCSLLIIFAKCSIIDAWQASRHVSRVVTRKLGRYELAHQNRKPKGRTAKDIVISPYFLVGKFCGKAQFLHSFGQLARMKRFLKDNWNICIPFAKIIAWTYLGLHKTSVIEIFCQELLVIFVKKLYHRCLIGC